MTIHFKCKEAQQLALKSSTIKIKSLLMKDDATAVIESKPFRHRNTNLSIK